MSNKGKPNRLFQKPGDIRFILKNPEGKIIMKFRSKLVAEKFLNEYNKNLCGYKEYTLEEI